MRALAALVLALSACAPAPVHGPAVVTAAPPARPVDLSFCANARPIRFGKLDRLTPSTAQQIIDHNNLGARLCGWKP